MTVDAERRPAVELRLDGAARGARHQAKRVTAQVVERAAALARQLELAPQRRELVVAVERAGTGEPGREFRCGHDYFGGITVPQRLQVRALASP